MTDEGNDTEREEIEDVLVDENSNDSGISSLKPTKRRADVWKHFDEIIEDGIKYAKCRYCDT